MLLTGWTIAAARLLRSPGPCRLWGPCVLSGLWAALRVTVAARRPIRARRPIDRWGGAGCIGPRSGSRLRLLRTLWPLRRAHRLLTLAPQFTPACQFLPRGFVVLGTDFAGRLAVEVKALRRLAEREQVRGASSQAPQKGRQRRTCEHAGRAGLDVDLDAQFDRFGPAAEQRRKALPELDRAGLERHARLFGCGRCGGHGGDGFDLDLDFGFGIDGSLDRVGCDQRRWRFLRRGGFGGHRFWGRSLGRQRAGRIGMGSFAGHVGTGWSGSGALPAGPDCPPITATAALARHRRARA